MELFNLTDVTNTIEINYHNVTYHDLAILKQVKTFLN